MARIYSRRDEPSPCDPSHPEPFAVHLRIVLHRMRRLGGTVAYAVVATLAIAAPISAQQDPAAPEPAPTIAAPAPTEPAPTTTETTPAPAPEPAAEPLAEAAPAPAEPAPAPVPAEAQAPEPQVIEDTAPVEPKKGEKKVTAIAAASTGVTISDFQFSPSSVTVNVGDTVTWTNDGPTPHSATSNDGVFDTGIMDAGQSGSHTFTEAGTFAYICTPHPNMTGTVVVQAAATDDGAADDTGSSGTTTESQADDGPSLPNSGLDVGGVAVLGLMTLALGAYLRRRTTPQPARPAGRIGW
jgi:plastocyanin